MLMLLVLVLVLAECQLRLLELEIPSQNHLVTSKGILKAAVGKKKAGKDDEAGKPKPVVVEANRKTKTLLPVARYLRNSSPRRIAIGRYTKSKVRQTR
jgi:hypothetical protein